uniref:Uncharacterized protein n=1 Tax=Peronospora matthiolae TaxID=2874970 RepID=A0AAV1UWQ5_9STRA
MLIETPLGVAMVGIAADSFGKAYAAVRACFSDVPTMQSRSSSV